MLPANKSNEMPKKKIIKGKIDSTLSEREEPLKHMIRFGDLRSARTQNQNHTQESLFSENENNGRRGGVKYKHEKS